MTGATTSTTSHLSQSDLEGWPPELQLLLGEDAGELLAAVAAAAGGELSSWRPRQVDHQPGRFTVVQYKTDVTWPGCETRSETLVAATGERIPEQGAAVFDDGENRVAAWRWTNDPFLPGIAEALNPTAVAALLDELGVDGGAIQLRTVAYRPARRAVVEATGRRGRLFLKVLRPNKVEDLHDLHRALTPELPVPRSLGWTDGGVLVLTALPGDTLRKALRSSSPPPPTPEAVTALLDKLPAELAERPLRRHLVSSAEHHASVIAATVPGTKERLDDLLGAIRSTLDPTPVETVPVHGDLYEAQLLVDRGRFSGLLDVDTTGAGHRVEDLANFCAHLSVLSLMSDRPRNFKRYGADLLAHAEQHHSPRQLRPRIAAAVISLATGPFRVLERGWQQNTRRRLDLAGEWINGLDRD